LRTQSLLIKILGAQGLRPILSILHPSSMNYNPHDHHRRSIRLPEYDYSQLGIYFVTLCTYQRQCLFGEIHGGKMCLNQVGKLVAQEWLNSSKIRQEIELDEWIIMPNHLHGIVVITDEGVNIENQRANIGSEGTRVEGVIGKGAMGKDAMGEGAMGKGASLAPLRGDGWQRRKPKSLSSFIGGFKSSVTKRIRGLCEQSNPPVWQRNFYESIVRNERQLNQIRQYILDNPQKWDDDPEKPQNQAQDLLIDFIF
jgi:REP element-mobilizing transposase RayT